MSEFKYFTVTVKRTVYQEVIIADVEAHDADEARKYIEKDMRDYRDPSRIGDVTDVDSEFEIEHIEEHNEHLDRLIDEEEKRLVELRRDHLDYSADATEHTIQQLRARKWD